MRRAAPVVALLAAVLLLLSGGPAAQAAGLTALVGWGSRPLATSPALNSWHDVSGGASGVSAAAPFPSSFEGAERKRLHRTRSTTTFTRRRATTSSTR